MRETYAEQLAFVRQLASSDAPREWQGNYAARQSYIDPYDRKALAAVLGRLDALERPVAEENISESVIRRLNEQFPAGGSYLRLAAAAVNAWRESL